ncbi:DUF4348 domain-containing protein [Flavobacterium sp. 17A]|uniref:DUF4348 domain-containing protein n=1 Tax=Flavobacterium potami TaxID=2872310 RepID=A0A9X1HB36_9FLAO|nr:DUF4348 domain-containing protein [Flavobacterium potami]MBZ4035209.1 DUF4348 domain-containing protein [Flavobacterium potami]
MKKIITLLSLFLLMNFINAQTKPVVADENFTTFLKKFNSDKNFHLSRINFPITVKLLNDDFELVNYTIAKSDYKQIQLNDKGSTYQYKNIPKNNTYIIKRKGIDNGILAEYIFEKRKRIWYLKTYIDEST